MTHIILILLLTTYNYDDGTTLEQRKVELPFLFPGTEARVCLEEGVERGMKMTAFWRAKGLGNASTNIVCMIRGGEQI